MYRTMLSVLLYTTTTLAAPPDNTGITYVKIQPTNQEPNSNPIAHPRSSQFRESRIENLPLTIRGYNIGEDKEPKNRRHIRSDDDESEYTTFSSLESEEVTDTTETATESTEKLSLEDKSLDDYEERKLPAPRFYSKLSYFEKANSFDSSLSTNLVESRAGKRRYRSKCRCERIWNCPKLQITVPRCPEEYFLCCF